MKFKFLSRAFKYAEISYINDEVPVGAIVVKDNEVIGVGYNLKKKNNLAFCHAELMAIRQASRAIGNWRLTGCDMYVTLDPCPMCASAIKQARIENVYSACENNKNNNTEIIKMIFKKDDSNPGVRLISNLDTNRSEFLLEKFFESKR